MLVPSTVENAISRYKKTTYLKETNYFVVPPRNDDKNKPCSANKECGIKINIMLVTSTTENTISCNQK